MRYLWLVSLLWAFSFGLIKGRLGGLDSVGVAVIRLSLAALVFLPWLRWRALPNRLALRLVVIGTVQFGLMYVFYLKAFAHLAAYEVAMFTVFTPLYVALMDSAVEQRVNRRGLLAAAIAVVGAAALKWDRGISVDGMIGFLLVQGSNLSFAAGQLAYRRLRQTNAAMQGRSDASLFALPYLGAAVAVGLFSIIATDWAAFAPTSSQWNALIYLGIIASGIGFFGWNYGASRASAGALAVANNIVVPLAVLVALVVFGETADPLRLTLSGALIGLALLLAEWPFGRGKTAPVA